MEWDWKFFQGWNKRRLNKGRLLTSLVPELCDSFLSPPAVGMCRSWRKGTAENTSQPSSRNYAQSYLQVIKHCISVLNFILDRKELSLRCWRFNFEALVTIGPWLFWLERGLPPKCLPREMLIGPSHGLGFFVSPKKVWVFPWTQWLLGFIQNFFWISVSIPYCLRRLLSGFSKPDPTRSRMTVCLLAMSTWTVLSRGHRV